MCYAGLHLCLQCLRIGVSRRTAKSFSCTIKVSYEAALTFGFPLTFVTGKIKVTSVPNPTFESSVSFPPSPFEMR